MKELSAKQNALLGQTGRSVHFFMSVDWPAPFGLRYYATRKLEPAEGVVCEGLIVKAPEFVREHETAVNRGLSLGRTQVSLKNPPDAGREARTTINATPSRIQHVFDGIMTATGIAVRCYCVLGPVEDGWTREDWVLLGYYRIGDYEIGTDEVLLHLVDWWGEGAGDVFGHEVLREEWPLCPTGAVGLVIPFTIGHLVDHRCLLLERGLRTHLALRMTDEDMTIKITDRTDWPSSGTVVIGNEEIRYSGIAAGAGLTATLTVTQRAYNGTNAAGHSQGGVVRLLRTRYRCFVADNAVRSVANVRVNGILLGASDYSWAVAEYQGRSVTFLDLYRLPPYDLGGPDGAVLSYYDEDNVIVLADAEGLENPWATGTTMRSVAHVLRYLLEGPEFLHLESGILDVESVEAALAIVGGTNWNFDWAIRRIQTKAELLRSCILCSAIRFVWENGRVRAFPSLSTTGGVIAGRVERQRMFTDVVRRYAHEDEIFNHLVFFYRPTLTGTSRHYEGCVVVDDVNSQQQAWGRRERRIFAEWIADSTTAAGVAAALLREYAWRRSVAEVDVPLDFVALEQGDVVVLDDADSGLDGQEGRVVGVRMPLPDSVRLRVAIVDRRRRVWEHDAANYIDIFAGPPRLHFVLGGVLAAVLREDGALWLRGNLIEAEEQASVVLAVRDSPTGCIEYEDSTGDIVFGLRDATLGLSLRVGRLTAAGDLQMMIFREIAEYQRNPWGPVVSFAHHYEWHGAVPALDFSLDLVRTYLRLARVISSGGVTNARLETSALRERALGE